MVPATIGASRVPRTTRSASSTPPYRAGRSNAPCSVSRKTCAAAMRRPSVPSRRQVPEKIAGQRAGAVLAQRQIQIEPDVIAFECHRAGGVLNRPPEQRQEAAVAVEL